MVELLYGAALYPSLFRRWKAWTLDSAIQAAMIVPAGLLVLAFDAPAVGLIAFLSGAFLFCVLYDAILTARDGQTPGKCAFGIRVIEVESGRPPSLTRSIVRAVFKTAFLPLYPVQYVWVVLNPNGRAMHDILADTIVVQVR